MRSTKRSVALSMSAISWSGTSSRLGRGATWNATSDRDRTSISAPVTRSTSVTGSPPGSAAASQRSVRSAAAPRVSTASEISAAANGRTS